MEGGERDLGGVEKLVCPLLRDGLNEDAVGGAGDEVADIVVAGQGGHRLAEGGASQEGGDDLLRG